MINRPNKMQFLVILLAMCLVLAGCTTAPAKSGPSTAAAGGTMTMRLFADWDTLDPQLARTVSGYQMVMALYDRLVALDGNGKIVPELAESWQVTDRSVTLKLKEGIRCADGTKLTATDVANSIERAGAPETKAPYVFRTLGDKGFTATGDDAARSVSIATAEPFSDLLLGLTMPWASIICAAGLKDQASLAAQAFGTGPFTLEKSVRGDTYQLKARPGYNWGPAGMTTADPGFPSELIVRVVSNETTAANLMLSGEVEVGFVVGQDLKRVQADKGLFRQEGTAFGTTFLIFNQDQGRLGADKNMRTALALAVNNQDYNQAATSGYGMAATSIITPVVDCYSKRTETLAQPFDPAKAKELLAAAGWRPGSDGLLAKDGKPLELTMIGYDGQNAGPEYLADALRKIGVKVTLTVTDLGTMFDTLFKTGQWDLAIYPFAAPMPSPNALTKFVSGTPPPAGVNVGHINNSAFDQAVGAALKAELSQRCGPWEQAQEALLTDVDLKPLAASKATWFGRNVKFSLINDMLLDVTSLRRVK